MCLPRPLEAAPSIVGRKLLSTLVCGIGEDDCSRGEATTGA